MLFLTQVFPYNGHEVVVVVIWRLLYVTSNMELPKCINKCISLLHHNLWFACNWLLQFQLPFIHYWLTVAGLLLYLFGSMYVWVSADVLLLGGWTVSEWDLSSLTYRLIVVIALYCRLVVCSICTHHAVYDDTCGIWCSLCDVFSNVFIELLQNVSNFREQSSSCGR